MSSFSMMVFRGTTIIHQPPINCVSMDHRPMVRNTKDNFIREEIITATFQIDALDVLRAKVETSAEFFLYV